MHGTTSRFSLAALLCVGALSGCKQAAQDTPAPPAAAAKDGKIGSASVGGTVRFTGPHEAPRVSNAMSAFPECEKKAAQDPVPVDAQGRLANVFVWIKGGLPDGTYAAPERAVVLDQKGCDYVPRVLGIQVGQKLELVNSDPLLHNVHSLGGGSNPMRQGPNAFNVAMQTQGTKVVKSFSQPQVPPVTITCDVHPWMRAYAGVLPHPFFAVTAQDGSFRIDKLPAGTYTVAFWQERYGVQERTVTVADGATASVDVEFKP